MRQKVKKNLSNRLHRIEGQIRGLSRLVEEETYCIDIITQAQAVKSALNSFENAMLKNHLETHVAKQMRGGHKEKAVTEILKVYTLAQKKK